MNAGAGFAAAKFEFAPGSPVRLVFGGAGGNRILGMTPRPVSRQFWTEVDRDVAAVSGIPYVSVDAALAGAQRRAQRAKPPSVGGDMAAFSSNSGSRMTPPPPWSRNGVETMLDFRVRLGDSGVCISLFISRVVTKGYRGGSFTLARSSAPIIRYASNRFCPPPLPLVCCLASLPFLR